MKEISSSEELRAAILELESRQATEGKMLKEQFLLAYDSIRPINLIKNTFREAIASEEIRDGILNKTLGVTAGFLSKKMYEGVSGGPFKKLIGNAVMFGVSNIVAKNPEVIKSLGKGLLNFIRRKPVDQASASPKPEAG